MDATVGQILRETREAQHISLDDVALRLRLMHRQIEAMEADDFQSLGQPVFARGFVRNYARLLGLDADALLARMAGAPAEPALVTEAEPPVGRSWLTSPWLIGLLLGLAVIVAIPVALYLWLNSEVDESVAPVTETRSAVESRPAPPPAAPEPIVAAVPEAVETPSANASASTPETAAESAADSAPAPASAPEPGTPNAADAAPSEGSIHIEFGDDAWVEVKDATGRLVHRQLNPAGSRADIRGRPPFAVVIGNATQARMTYNGRPIDLKPFIDVSVARFTLEE